VVAPTGIAALNAGGVTIHSQFLLPFGSFVPDRDMPGEIPEGTPVFNRTTLTRHHPLNSMRKKVLRATELLIIDEVSMLRADILDAIDFRMRRATGDYSRSFGGAQLLMIGDSPPSADRERGGMEGAEELLPEPALFRGIGFQERKDGLHRTGPHLPAAGRPFYRYTKPPPPEEAALISAGNL
jgi:hypothetical protein